MEQFDNNTIDMIKTYVEFLKNKSDKLKKCLKDLKKDYVNNDIREMNNDCMDLKHEYDELGIDKSEPKNNDILKLKKFMLDLRNKI